MKDITIAAATFNSRLGRFQENLAGLERALLQAKAEGVELLICPEACLTGYGVGPKVLESALAAEGPLVGSAAKLAAEAGIGLIVGLIEKSRTRLAYLSQLVINGQGVITGSYRKVHLGPTETDRFQPGRELGLARFSGLSIGLQLCYDGHFPQQALAQARSGAELITVSHASPGETPETKKERWLRYLTARAYDNTVFLAACNQLGDNGQGLDFSGLALILGPKGEILAQHLGPEPGLAVAALPAAYLERIRNSRMGHFQDHNRPDLYSAWRQKD